jgi:ferredoxin-thioredoxin reductase catalytic subunit
VNPDESMTRTLVDGLSRQSSRFGRPYCPCRDVDGVEADRDVICPCVYAAADIGEHGQCYCALFLSPLKDPRTVQSIPERRP